MSRRALRWTVLAAILLVAAYGAASFLMLQGATSAERKPQEATPPEYGLDYGGGALSVAKQRHHARRLVSAVR